MRPEKHAASEAELAAAQAAVQAAKAAAMAAVPAPAPSAIPPATAPALAAAAATDSLESSKYGAQLLRPSGHVACLRQEAMPSATQLQQQRWLESQPPADTQLIAILQLAKEPSSTKAAERMPTVIRNVASTSSNNAASSYSFAPSTAYGDGDGPASPSITRYRHLRPPLSAPP